MFYTPYLWGNEYQVLGISTCNNSVHQCLNSSFKPAQQLVQSLLGISQANCSVRKLHRVEDASTHPSGL